LDTRLAGWTWKWSEHSAKRKFLSSAVYQTLVIQLLPQVSTQTGEYKKRMILVGRHIEEKKHFGT
jgi:hypothetical protein